MYSRVPFKLSRADNLTPPSADSIPSPDSQRGGSQEIIISESSPLSNPGIRERREISHLPSEGFSPSHPSSSGSSDHPVIDFSAPETSDNLASVGVREPHESVKTSAAEILSGDDVDRTQSNVFITIQEAKIVSHSSVEGAGDRKSIAQIGRMEYAKTARMIIQEDGSHISMPIRYSLSESSVIKQPKAKCRCWSCPLIEEHGAIECPPFPAAHPSVLIGDIFAHPGHPGLPIDLWLADLDGELRMCWLKCEIGTRHPTLGGYVLSVKNGTARWVLKKTFKESRNRAR